MKHLYGRKSDYHKLIENFEGIQRGRHGTILVSGSAGSGKTTLITKFAVHAEANGALLVYAKADALARRTPFSTLTAVMNIMVQKAIAENPNDMDAMRTRVGSALNPVFDPLTDLPPMLHLVPALTYLFDDMPSKAVSGYSGPAIESAQWVHLRLLALLETFATMCRPLVLLLDDVQWFGEASHKFLQYLADNGNLAGLMLVMAYRAEDWESDPVLQHTVSLYQHKETTIPIALKGLTKRDTRAWLKGKLDTKQDLSPLADVCHGKTAGNPFYLNQLLEQLLETEVVSHKNGEWLYDIAQIDVLAFTENVIELLIKRMGLVERDSLDLLKQAACIHGDISVPLLEATSGFSRQKIQTLLWKPIKMELLQQTEKGFRFTHDRIPESLEAQVKKDEAIAVHKRIVAFLLAEPYRADVKSNLFTILYHYAFYADTTIDSAIQSKMARLYFMAGEQARNRSAYGMALDYFIQGKAHFPGDIWTLDYALALEFCRHIAECAYLDGDFAAAETIFEEAAQRTASLSERLAVEMVKIPCYQAQAKEAEALAAGRDILRELGFRFPDAPSDLRILYAILKAWLRYIFSSKNRIRHKQMMPDTNTYKAAKCIGALGATMYLVSPQKLLPLLTATSFHLSLKHGSMPDTPVAFIVFGMIMSQLTGSIKWGRTLGGMARQISDHFSDARLKTKEKTMINMFLDHWNKPLDQAVADFASAEAFCLRYGDHEFYAYNAIARLHCQMIRSTPLDHMLHEIDASKKVFSRMNNSYALTTAGFIQQTIANLAKGVPAPWILTGVYFDESGRDDLIGAMDTELTIYKFIAAVYCGRMDIAAEIKEFLVIGDEMAADAYVYNYFLFLSALVDIQSNGRKKIIKRHLKRLKKFAAYNEDVYGNKYLLAKAEHQRRKGDPEAVASYQAAAEAAECHGLWFEKALALEGLAKLSQALSESTNAEHYFGEASRLYRSWGLKWREGVFDDTTPANIQNRHSIRTETTARNPFASQGSADEKTNTPGDPGGVYGILQTMKAMSGARVIHIATREPHHWRSRFYIDDRGLHQPEIIVPLPEKVLSFASTTGERIQSDADHVEERCLDTAYYLKHRPTSMVVVPGKYRNVIYMENAEIKHDMTPLFRLAEQLLTMIRPYHAELRPGECPDGVAIEELQRQCRMLQAFMMTHKVYQDQTLSLAGLAQKVNMPQRTITDAINTCLGQNFKAFVNNYRIEAVKEKLCDPDYQNHTILDIAYAQGFNSKSAFNSIFKQIVGTTPSEYRNLKKERCRKAV